MSTIINGTSSAITFPDTTVQNTAFTTGAVTQSTIATGVAGTGPAFGAYQNSSQALSVNTYTKVQLQAEEFDTANCFDSTTNYRFTPNVAGYYQLNGATYVGGNALIGIYKNGSEYKRGNQVGTVNAMAQLTVSTIIYLNGSTDYVELWAYTGVGASLTANSINTYFNGCLIRSA